MGLYVNRFFSGSVNWNESVKWEWRDAKIKSGDGKILFEQRVEVPVGWSETATNIVASKYLYGDIKKGDDPSEGGRENSVKQLIHRVADAITLRGINLGYFKDEEGADNFYNELGYILVNQFASFNSPVWFNVGLFEQYGIRETGDKKLFNYNPETGKVERVDPYEYPQGSACFIIDVKDSIDDIWTAVHESARLFKYGSGVGADWSKLRSTKETISGGGKPSGPVSFMKVQDATGGTIKSGGKTRRAAIMQTLRVDHPDIMEFVNAKQIEEKKAWALIEEGYDGSFNGPAYGSVAFQNVNQSVRLTDEFMTALKNGDKTFELKGVDGSVVTTVNPKEVMRGIAEGTYVCGDPGVQYHDTINNWHTVPNDGEIESSNPCSEYMSLNNTACNLSSINLIKFLRIDTDGQVWDMEVPSLQWTTHIMTVAQDILVDMSGYPSEAIAENSYKYRNLGLGFSNLGGLIMALGHPYDSETGRLIGSACMALIHAQALHTSAKLAKHMGAFEGFERNKDEMMGVVDTHLEKLRETFNVSRLLLLENSFITNMFRTAHNIMAESMTGPEYAAEHGYRNSQSTVLAPTGTISFMMDCDTTGIEPELSLVKYKLLAGEGDGMIKIVNRLVPLALRRLGYTEDEIVTITEYIEEHGYVEGCDTLKDKHLPVFDTSFQPHGSTRSIPWKAHLEMMAACQPFISGAISKTVNMPENATVEEIEDAYVYGWELGLKAVAIYRENSKRSQPLTTKKTVGVPKETSGGDGQSFEPITPEVVYKPVRERLPDERESVAHKFSIGGHEGYIHVGFYPDGRPGELFIRMSKEGSTISGLMDAFATSISVALQWGVPVEDLANKFTHTRFEPSGFTSNPNIRQTTSVVDYIFKYLLDVSNRRNDVSIPELKVSEEFVTTVTGELKLNDALVTALVSEMDRFTSTSDAPPCSVCGTITQRAGSCYTCPSCGNSTGCG